MDRKWPGTWWDGREALTMISGGGLVTTWPVCASHNWIAWSSEPEIVWVSLGENVTDKTEFVCPLNGPAMVLLAHASHTRMVWSPEPETMCVPSGGNATDQTECVCPSNGPAMVSPVHASHTRCWTYSPCPSVVHIWICSHSSYLVYSVDIRCVPWSESITFTCCVSSLCSCQQVMGPATSL